MKRVILILAMLTGLARVASAETWGGVALTLPSAAVSSNHDVLVDEDNGLSFQVEYASHVHTASTVSDGAFATANITVSEADFLLLDGRASSTTITLQDTKNTAAAIGDEYITINGHRYTEGVDWNRSVISSTVTMKSLQTAIDAHWEYVATVTSNVITVTAASIGTTANSWSISSSVQTDLSVTAWSAGQAYGYLSINGVTLTEGTDWNAVTSSDTTASLIADAINSNTTLAALVTASTPTIGVVTITADSAGVNAYPISVSNAAVLTPNYVRLTGGSASHVSVADNTFYEPTHGFGVGLPLLLNTVSGTAPTGLTAKTTYYAIPVDADYYKLADVSTNAVAGSAINITAVTGSGSFTLTPLAFTAGSAGFGWFGSNDGSTFHSVLSLAGSSVTYAADGGGLWNFADYPYKYLRFAYTGPTYGGIDITATLLRRKD